MKVLLSTPTAQIYVEAPTSPMLDIANDRALSQLLGLHMTDPGRRILYILTNRAQPILQQRLVSLRNIIKEDFGDSLLPLGLGLPRPGAISCSYQLLARSRA